MKGILKRGFLSIQRGSKLQIQTCPYCNDTCGDWCPMMVTDNAGLCVKICNGVIVELLGDEEEEDLANDG